MQFNIADYGHTLMTDLLVGVIGSWTPAERQGLA